MTIDAQVEVLIPKAKERAAELGHAVAICKFRENLFIADSWQPVAEGRVLRLVGHNGQVVRV